MFRLNATFIYHFGEMLNVLDDRENDCLLHSLALATVLIDLLDASGMLRNKYFMFLKIANKNTIK